MEGAGNVQGRRVGNKDHETVVRLENITKEYPAGMDTLKVINDVSLEIHNGEFIVILGQSGSGKTTLLNIISALVSPTKGRAFVHGKDVTSLSDKEVTQFRAQNIGLVFQFFNLFSVLTLVENIEIGVALKLKDPVEIRKRAARYLEMVGLGSMCSKYPSQISGGEQQRVAVARAVITSPKLILADEPTGNLNSAQGEEVMALFAKLNEEGTTIVQATHSEKNASYGRRVIHLLDGWVDAEEDIQ